MFIHQTEQYTNDRLEGLRIPFESPDCNPAWKDWFHYILINPENGIKILLNLYLSGKPGNGEVQATVVVSKPGMPGCKQATYADLMSLPWEMGMVSKRPLIIKTEHILFQVQNGESSVWLRANYSNLELKFLARPKAGPIHVEERTRFGSGFIGWGFNPAMTVQGSVKAGGERHYFDSNWYCYHDRNFGVFRWGENIGWEWFVCNLKDEKGQSCQVVFDQRTGKNHLERGFPYVFIFRENRLKRVFVGMSLDITWQREKKSKTPLRLPGHLATVFSSRISSDVQSIIFTAGDERDRLSLQMRTEKSYQIVVPDNETRQYTIMEEISGKAKLLGSLNGNRLKATGYFYGEFVR